MIEKNFFCKHAMSSTFFKEEFFETKVVAYTRVK